MQVNVIKTHKITGSDKDVFAVLDKYLPEVSEGSIVVVTSKILSIIEGRVVKIGDVSKEELVAQEAEFYLPADPKYHFSLTIKNSLLIPSAGIDESNGNGYYVLWPKDPQKWANDIRDYLVKKFHLKNIGVIITDSKTTPLRWGVTGAAIAYSGFMPLNDQVGTPDVFGRVMQATKVNVMDGLSAAAVVVMGESSEQTPLAVIEDAPFVQFVNRNPTAEELQALKINLKDDLYAPLLKSVEWKKGKND
ncbi:MAG: coenzyme F420-0:L-glutamate ligase [Candidatus Levybacteria bacterium]|nr:coenzyme F420-0:L-glutamate ligase [Candidatus Levybacteria bacterium]